MHMRGTCLRPAVGQQRRTTATALESLTQVEGGRRGATVRTPGQRPAEVELRGAAPPLPPASAPLASSPTGCSPGGANGAPRCVLGPNLEETEALPDPAAAASACSPLRPHSFKKKRASASRLLCPKTTKRRKRPLSPNDATALGDCSSGPVPPPQRGGRLRPWRAWLGRSLRPRRSRARARTAGSTRSDLGATGATTDVGSRREGGRRCGFLGSLIPEGLAWRWAARARARPGWHSPRALRSCGPRGPRGATVLAPTQPSCATLSKWLPARGAPHRPARALRVPRPWLGRAPPGCPGGAPAR